MIEMHGERPILLFAAMPAFEDWLAQQPGNQQFHPRHLAAGERPA